MAPQRRIFCNGLLRYKLRAKISFGIIIGLAGGVKPKMVRENSSPPNMSPILPPYPMPKSGRHANWQGFARLTPMATAICAAMSPRSWNLITTCLPSPAIDWNKGCYIGQEIVARTHYRGLLKYRLFTVEFMNFAENDARPGFGAAISDQNGKEIGSLCSQMGHFALAHLRLDAVKNALENKENLRCGNFALAVHPPQEFSLS